MTGIQVREAVLLATSRKTEHMEVLMTVDLTSLTVDRFEIAKDANCKICS
ncbi:MAG: hypothetical protein R6V83_02350 [Candidatus Thorarchaeota archaeon]